MTPATRDKLRAQSLSLARVVLGIDVPENGRHVACPLHGGASFHWYAEGGHFKCFGCPDEYAGDIVDLTMRLRGCSLPEAERLLSQGQPSPRSKPRRADAPSPPAPILSDEQPPEGQVLVFVVHGDDYRSSTCSGRAVPWEEYAAAQTAEPPRLRESVAEYHDGREVVPLKAAAGWYVPAMFTGTTRGKDYVRAVTVLWLDADHATPRLKAEAYAGRGLFNRARIVRPTCSSRPGLDKLRIEFPLKQWLTGEAAREATLELMAAIEAEYGGQEVWAIWGETDKHGNPITALDDKAATVSQCSFSPVLCSDAPHEAQWFPGRATDGAKLAEMWRERTAIARTQGPEAARHATQDPDGQECWPEPEVLPLAPTFPSLSDTIPGTRRARIHEVIPPELAAYLVSVAASQELTPESVIVSTLPKIVLAIGPDVLARGNGEHFETLSTWDMAVLPPGARKSAGFAASQGALSELRDNLEAKGRERRAEWFSRESCREQEEKTLKNRVAAYFAGKHGEAKAGSKPPTASDLEDYKTRLAEIAAERLRDADPGRVEIYSSNATPEAVVERVAAARCFAMLSAEGATVIEGLAEYRGGDDGAPIGHWCSLYSGDEVRSTRAGRETLTIPSKSATLSVGITVQRDVLDRAQENRSMRTRGFLTRFSKYFAAPSVARGAKPPPRNGQAEKWFDDTLRRIAANRPASTTYLACSPEAATMLREFELECRARAVDIDDLGDEPSLAEWACKAHGLALRKAALFHVVQGFDYATPIRAQTLGWAIALTRTNLETETVLVQSGRDGLPRRLHRFGELVRKSGLCELTARVAHKKGWAPDVETARSLLGHLVEHGWLGVDVRKDPRAGRPSTVYLVNPRIHTPHPEGGKTGETPEKDSSAGFAGYGEGGHGTAADRPDMAAKDGAIAAEAPPPADGFREFLDAEPSYFDPEPTPTPAPPRPLVQGGLPLVASTRNRDAFRGLQATAAIEAEGEDEAVYG